MLGFLVGLGFANYPVMRLLGRPASLREKETGGVGRYFGLCTDHKVVGMQYLVGIGVFIFIGGLNAMLIRYELLTPDQHAWNANNYLTLVGVHGTMMMGMMTSGILGPFANYLLPIMIGARRMAFPRIEALTFWLLMAGGVLLMTTWVFGGFPTGWTGYEPLANQANWGMDAYIAFFALVGLSMCLLGLNMIATVITMRAPGMTWGRLPMFVWGTVSTAVLMVLAAPVLISALLMVLLDRTAQTGFFNPQTGGSSVPVPEPLLDLRPPGGLHPRAARHGHPARDPARVRAQARLGLPPGGERDARDHAALLPRLAAPPVRERDQRRSATVLHALDRADLAADRLHLRLCALGRSGPVASG